MAFIQLLLAFTLATGSGLEYGMKPNPVAEIISNQHIGAYLAFFCIRIPTILVERNGRKRKHGLQEENRGDTMDILQIFNCSLSSFFETHPDCLFGDDMLDSVGEIAHLAAEQILVTCSEQNNGQTGELFQKCIEIEYNRATSDMISKMALSWFSRYDLRVLQCVLLTGAICYAIKLLRQPPIEQQSTEIGQTRNPLPIKEKYGNASWKLEDGSTHTTDSLRELWNAGKICARTSVQTSSTKKTNWPWRPLCHYFRSYECPF